MDLRDPRCCAKSLKPNPSVRQGPDGSSEPLNHFESGVRMPPNGFAIARERQAIQREARSFVTGMGYNLLHHSSVSRVHEDVPQKGAKVAPVLAKNLPGKPVILWDVGGNLGLGNILNRHFPSAIKTHPVRTTSSAVFTTLRPITSCV